MKHIDLLKELQKLAPPEGLGVIEDAWQLPADPAGRLPQAGCAALSRPDLEETPEPRSLAERKQEMAAAAQAWQADYAARTWRLGEKLFAVETQRRRTRKKSYSPLYSVLNCC